MIKEYLKFAEGKLHLVFGITGKNRIRLMHFGAVPYEESVDRNLTDPNAELYLDDGYQFAQINLAGYDRPYEKQGNMYVATVPGATMVYAGCREERNEFGRVLVICQRDEVTGIQVETCIQFYDGRSVARFTNTVTNIGTKAQTLEYLGSFSYLGFEKEGLGNADRKMRLYVPHNGWQKELTWASYTFEELGIAQTQPHIMNRTSKTIEFTNTGHWSAKAFLPMGYIENTEADCGLFFQIEHNGSWHWEIGMQDNHFYLNVSGPTELQSHFSKDLEPGESFTGVPVCVGVSRADISEAMSELTLYRRLIRRPNRDNEELPVIFNDYMNCLFGDPTTAKELPLIDAAAEAGCEYYVIDAGWYADGSWWDGVGEWQESRKRFPGGIAEVTSYIRSRGMVPGVWLELEVMGINCGLAKKAPDDWFFVRHGRRVYDRSRYQLDFRNPEVRAHVSAVIDRVVNEYGVGYIKMDYNIEPGIGTEKDADSFGDGLLQHERAYLAWLDGIFRKYPDLVIENCSSGGLRMDYALLRRCSVQSTSDQEDYVQYSTISANVPTGVTSEQAAVWSYPLKEETALRFAADASGATRLIFMPDGRPDLREETVFNMVNAMLCRIHQSGHLGELAPERIALVKEGISCYKNMRQDIRRAVPFWPLGLARTTSPWVSLAIRTPERAYLAVWRRGTPDTGAGSDCCELPLEGIFRMPEGMTAEAGQSEGTAAGAEKFGQCEGTAAEAGQSGQCRNAAPEGRRAAEVRLSYPLADGELGKHCSFRFNRSSQVLTVRFTEPVMARIFEILPE